VRKSTSNEFAHEDAGYRQVRIQDFRPWPLWNFAGSPSSNRRWDRQLNLLHNIGQIVSTDFFTAPAITMKVLFVFIVLVHGRC
jgi:hypothetical protein